MASQPLPLLRSSTFDSSNEGWYVDVNGTFAPATWSGSGGDPGGYIAGQFGNGFFQSVPGDPGTTWSAGNALSDYGGTLQANVTSTDPTTDIVLGFFSSNSSVIPCEDAGTTGSGWGTATATLDTGHLIDCSTLHPLTGAQASAALAGFEAMLVGPSVTDHNSIMVGLDNTQLNGPAIAVTPPTGKVARTFGFRYAARKFRGTLTAPNDYSCAAKAKVTIFRAARKPVKIGIATTSAPDLRQPDGPASFSFKLKKIVKGSYYATVAKAKSSLDGNTCAALKSYSVLVR